MFPVSHNENALISHFDPFFYDIEDPTLFPTTPYEYEEDILLQQYQNLSVYQQQTLRAYENTIADIFQEDASCRENAAQELNKKTTCIPETQNPKKKPAKKDRHSKINTAQGPRDRRMRMSLEVAKQFFALQDMLGFDKASKTVEWLLIQAKDEIINLARGFHNSNQSFCNVTPKSASSNSEVDFLSGNDESPNRKNETDVSLKEKDLTGFDKGKKRVRKQRTKASQVGKESREKARERARERTKEKMRSRRLNEVSFSNQGCTRSGPFESTNGSYNSNYTFEDVLAEVEEPISSKKQDQDMADEGPMVIMGNWSPSLVFNYLQSHGVS